MVLHFSDCQTGAAADCVAGSNANPGTMASPKRDLSGIALDALPGNAHLLFRRGGSWSWSAHLENVNATVAAPLVFDAYGSGAAPLLRVTSGNGFTFAEYQSTLVDGGYVLRNLRLDGLGTAQWGILLTDGTRGVLMEGLEISGFAIGVHMQNGAVGNHGVTIRGSRIADNRDHGILGDANDLVIESNVIEGNNPSGGGFEHGIYLGGHAVNVRVAGNTFRRNSAPGGVCNGGNLTVHGQYDGLVIENNRIEQDSALGGCYGISITAAYASAEFFRNLVIRSNTIINVGNCSVCVSSAPGALIEANKVYVTQAQYHVGVIVPGIPPGPEDVVDTNPIVRDNLVCLVAPSAGSSAVSANVPGASLSNNTYVTGAGASSGVCAR